MVNRIVAGWSWEEDLTPEQRSRLGRRIVAELDARLGAGSGRRLYAFTGNPRLSPQLLAALQPFPEAGRDLRQVARPGRTDAYVTGDPDLFARILPIVFDLGPPEIAVLALYEGAIDGPGALGRTIGKIVERAGPAAEGAVCMAFDSGDLVRIV